MSGSRSRWSWWVAVGVVVVLVVPAAIGWAVLQVWDGRDASAEAEEDPRLAGVLPAVEEMHGLCESTLESALNVDDLAQWSVEERVSQPGPSGEDEADQVWAELVGCLEVHLASSDHGSGVSVAVSYQEIVDDPFADDEGVPQDLAFRGEDEAPACVLVELSSTENLGGPENRGSKESVDDVVLQEQVSGDVAYCVLAENTSTVRHSFVERNTVFEVSVERENDEEDAVDDVLPMEKAALAEAVTVRLVEGLRNV